MKSLVIIILLVVILIIIMHRTVSSFDLTENGSGSCQACPPLANGFKYTYPANGCQTTACPTGYTTGSDPTNCSECATGYSKTGTDKNAACQPTVTTCPGHQSVVNNVCTNCSLPTNSIWNSSTGCASTACPQNSTADASGTICKCADNYIADPTKTACVALNCTGRTQISGAPIATMQSFDIAGILGGSGSPPPPPVSLTTSIGAAAQQQQQQQQQQAALAATPLPVRGGGFGGGGPGK
jgi:hypothetical protein